MHNYSIQHHEHFLSIDIAGNHSDRAKGHRRNAGEKNV
jgi:hypothetical protein